jgi:hypothetical protein
VGIRGRLRKLEREARGEFIEIPQRDGTVARFPAEEGMEAYMNLMERLGAGENAPPEHPLIAAARISSEPKWTPCFCVTAPSVESRAARSLWMPLRTPRRRAAARSWRTLKAGSTTI